MAANLQKHRLVSLGKRLVNHISYSTARNSANSSTGLSGRRAVHMSDKNLEEYLSSVPGEVIKVQSDKYWTPHPQTGVFGPATDHIICGEQGFHFCPVDSVLEQKVFFRADLEDLE
ncbi:late embryogenesis abundant protein At5g17165-like [Lycium barbarum]|uniref:late embryogenesis abundant protein At5g17165-like n=1 Tax=Lycium barbarum TaxID=112863 RepID=UPI00293E5A70|nr:late embryogenesis abundant protein At5g17165-like [Lycium barbarum]